MSIQDLAGLAEILGIFGVLASLIYVGKQVRQHTLQMRVAASHDRLQVFLQLFLGAAIDRDFAEVWRKGDSEFSTLDETDQLRLLLWETGGLTAIAHFFGLHRNQLLPDEDWRAVVHSAKTLGQRESVRRAWASSKGRFGHAFQRFLTEHVE